MLESVLSLAVQMKMSVFIGLLDLMDPNLPPLWGPCMSTYASLQVIGDTPERHLISNLLQGEVAAKVSAFIKSKFGDSFSFAWYMVSRDGGPA